MPDSQYPLPSACPPCRHKKRAGVNYSKLSFMEVPVPTKEEYTYQVGKIQFIVTPVYKDKGESMRDILLKLMLADLEPA